MDGCVELWACMCSCADVMIALRLLCPARFLQVTFAGLCTLVYFCVAPAPSANYKVSRLQHTLHAQHSTALIARTQHLSAMP